MLKYLHHSHAHADSQDDSTVFQKPLLHAVDAALGGGKEAAVRRNTAHRGDKQRRDPGRSLLEKHDCWLGVWAAEGKNNTAQEARGDGGLEQWILPRTNTPAPVLEWPLCPGRHRLADPQ